MKIEKIINDLVSIILEQENELNELKNKIRIINDYIDSYDNKYRGADIDGNNNTSGNFKE